MPGAKKPEFISILIFLSIITITLASIVLPQPARAAIIRVPDDQPTIQLAINAASNGDIVLVAPGTYYEELVIAGKAITLASHFYSTANAQHISNTIINANGGTGITIESTAGPETTIIGFSIINGTDGIYSSAYAKILHNRFINNGDGMDVTDGSGEIRDNYFWSNQDDGIDLDESSQAIIENNVILENGNDGIEIRLHAHTASQLTIIIRNNTIIGNLEDGIQLIDYAGLSSRVFYIERNIIANNAMAGIGLMDNAETDEDFRGAPIPERIHVTNNTITGNPYGLTGGANLIALNNLIVNSSVMGLKNLTGSSVAAYNLFWNNGTNYTNSLVDLPTSLFSNPLLDVDYHLLAGSPAIDSGTATFSWNGEVVLNLPAGAYAGAAPDRGAYEVNGPRPSPTPTRIGSATPIPSPTSTPTPTPLPPVLFAVIGEYGTGDQNAAAVASLVKSWNPDFVVTVGGNNYPVGSASTIDKNIGKDYHGFLYPYSGAYGTGAGTNRFFPAMDEYDLETSNGQPYLDFFALPGNERYYDFVRGAAHFFILNSNPTEPDGTSSKSAQAAWLEKALGASSSTWNIVIFHHPPYSSGRNGSSAYMRWPFAEWGAHVVLSGHDQTYERLSVNGLPYFINGLGGAGTNNFQKVLPESQVRYNKDFGALLVKADESSIKLEFRTVGGDLIDSISLKAGPRKTPTPIPLSELKNKTWLPFVSSNP